MTESDKARHPKTRSVENCSQQSSAPVANTPDTSQTGEKPRILVIDDSRLVRVSISKVLRAEFTIVEAGDGEDGWEKLNTDPLIQAVITDAGMPKLDGYGLIERIRQDNNTRICKIPVMMITGAEASETKARQRALDLGATDFITKPFDKTQLLARVRGYTRLDQTQRNLEDTEEALAEQSVIDPVTGTHNRRYFLQRGEQSLAFVKRHHQELSVIVIGIDRFDKLQEQHGEDIAGKSLAWAATIISDIKRKEDIIARVDDSRFAIVAPSAGRMAAAVLCERIRKQFLTATFTEADYTISVTVSLGLSCHGRETSETIEDLLKTAEQRADQAHQQGGNRTVASNKKPKSNTLPISTPSIDMALNHIKNGQAEKLQPFLALLARRMMPLIELCNKKLNWQIDEQISVIKASLEE